MSGVFIFYHFGPVVLVVLVVVLVVVPVLVVVVALALVVVPVLVIVVPVVVPSYTLPSPSQECPRWVYEQRQGSNVHGVLPWNHVEHLPDCLLDPRPVLLVC
jgi:hypothetical protein